MLSRCFSVKTGSSGKFGLGDTNVLEKLFGPYFKRTFNRILDGVEFFSEHTGYLVCVFTQHILIPSNSSQPWESNSLGMPKLIMRVIAMKDCCSKGKSAQNTKH